MLANQYPPRIEKLRVKNFRALKDFEMNISPLTVLLGANGSGKSTVFDVFAFLSEAFSEPLRKPWDKRGRLKELRSRGSEGPIEIEIKYRESPNEPLITYFLAIDERDNKPIIMKEYLTWRRGIQSGAPYKIIDYKEGKGRYMKGESPVNQDDRIEYNFADASTLAVSALGLAEQNPRIKALKDFITGWHLSYLSTKEVKESPQAGSEDRLITSGGNLANVIQYLAENRPASLVEIFDKLKVRIPHLQEVTHELTSDQRLLLMLKDAPFAQPILHRFASEGTMKMLTYLVLLFGSDRPSFIGIEEPENFLHPKLLGLLAEECVQATENSQLLITTHSPFLIDKLKPNQVWALYRDEKGYTKALNAAKMVDIPNMIANGGSLGDLWMEGFFEQGSPALI